MNISKRPTPSPFQSAIRPKYSGNTALACPTNSWLTAMNNSEVISVVFRDMKKAFDLADHDILVKIAICIKNSCYLHFFKIVFSFQNAMRIAQGSYSSNDLMKFGVLQGSVLGPVPFSIFIIDLP